MANIEQQTPSEKAKRPRFINPPNRLKEKVGDGGIPAILLKKGQEYIENNHIDFEPHAESFMHSLEEALQHARNSHGDDPAKLIAMLTQPVMELKANGGMFQYNLVSMIADVVLRFLENINELNDDVCDIIEVHNKTIGIIIKNRLKGDGGHEGAALARELYEACNRYYKKYDITS